MKSDRHTVSDNAFDRLIVRSRLAALAILIDAADAILSTDALQMRPSDVSRLRRAREAHRTAQAALDAAKEE